MSRLRTWHFFFRTCKDLPHGVSRKPLNKHVTTTYVMLTLVTEPPNLTPSHPHLYSLELKLFVRLTNAPGLLPKLPWYLPPPPPLHPFSHKD